jgi:hypothetical protein
MLSVFQTQEALIRNVGSTRPNLRSTMFPKQNVFSAIRLGLWKINESSRSSNVLSRVWVTIGGVWIHECIYWPLISTKNYSVDLHNSQIAIVPTKPFHNCYVFISRSLVKVSNNGDFSASRAQFLSSQPPMPNCLLVTPFQHGPRRNARFPKVTILLHGYSLQ